MLVAEFVLFAALLGLWIYRVPHALAAAKVLVIVLVAWYAVPVSYTHLDVYKRQICARNAVFPTKICALRVCTVAQEIFSVP